MSDTVTNLADELAEATYSLICEFSGGEWEDELREWAAEAFPSDPDARSAVVAAVERRLAKPY